MPISPLGFKNLQKLNFAPVSGGIGSEFCGIPGVNLMDFIMICNSLAFTKNRIAIDWLLLYI